MPSQPATGGGLDWMPPPSFRMLLYSTSKVVSGNDTGPWPGGFLLAAAVAVTLVISLFLCRPLSGQVSR